MPNDFVEVSPLPPNHWTGSSCNGCGRRDSAIYHLIVGKQQAGHTYIRLCDQCATVIRSDIERLENAVS